MPSSKFSRSVVDLHFNQILCVALDPFDGLQEMPKVIGNARAGFELEYVAFLDWNEWLF